MIPPDCWQAEHQLTFTLHLLLAEAEYLAGNFAYAEMLYSILLTNAHTTTDKLAIYFVQIAHYHLQGKFPEALGNECYGRFWCTLGEEDVAELYFRRAYDLYKQWGATGKIQEMESRYAGIFSPSPDTVAAHTQLDFLTVMKATQAISEEINLDKLLSKMMAIIVTNSGAQKGILITAVDGRSQQTFSSASKKLTINQFALTMNHFYGRISHKNRTRRGDEGQGCWGETAVYPTKTSHAEGDEERRCWGETAVPNKPSPAQAKINH